MSQARLVVLAGFVSKQEWPLPEEGQMTIGRDRRRSIPIMSRRVSRDHARLTTQKGITTVQDLGSKTGTLVNNRKIRKTVLRHGDLVKIGDVVFRFRLEEAEPRSEEPPAASRPLVIPPKPAPEPKEPGSDIFPAASEISPLAFSEEELALVGRTVADIKVIAPIAKGRRTVVYKGTHSARNRVVALKVLNREAAQDPDAIRWFVTGVKSAADLKHEDMLVPMSGGRAGDLLYVFSAFMEKGNALNVFGSRDSGGMSGIKRALEALVHVARALEYAQTQNLFHLGIRPTKILFDEKSRPKLLGLGFDNTSAAPGAARTTDIVAYLAPEQVSGSDEPAATTDVFSLGATFYFMLTRKKPTRDHRQRIGSPKLINPAVPDSICRILEKMLMPDPAKRYPSYGQFIHDVRWALRGEAWPHA